ncbi:MAG: DUF4263 domain-containing protein [Planctomycetia bacterium]|nr:DUF4263 domain-containing protein [Planctomycetia bacterium]
MIFEPVTYKLATDGPPAMSWSQYMSEYGTRYKQLLSSDPPEDSLHKFFRDNPSFLIGVGSPSFGMATPPFRFALIDKPRLQGITCKEPDFMWVLRDSATWYLTLVEIEKPSKRIFSAALKSKDLPKQEFNQARNQLHQWKTWFQVPENTLLFNRFYRTQEMHQMQARALRFLLVFGRRQEFEDNESLQRHRSSLLSQADEHLSSFDRLAPNNSFSDMITAHVDPDGKFRAIAVPPTFTIGPMNADISAHIISLDEAINQSPSISSERKQFLCERLPYWKEWALKDGTRRCCPGHAE